MFPGKLSSTKYALIEEGLPSLNEAMRVGKIDTPRRIAAFCTTLLFESRFEYNIREIGDTRVYGGRGYIQLTGEPNYTSAGKYLGIDLLGSPDLAMSREWSARIALWYWTVARPSCNSYADTLRMGKVNAAIGYPRSADGSNDNARCLAFAKALEYLTGKLESVDCSRTDSVPPPVFITSEPKGIWRASNGDLVNNNVRTDNKYPVGSQTLKVWGTNRWEVLADHNNAPAAPGAIKSYACTQRNFVNRTIDSFTEIVAAFDMTNPKAGEWDAAFDIWWGTWGAITGEFMVWPDHLYNGALPPKNVTESTTVTIDGQSYIAWRRPLNSGDPRWYIALVMNTKTAAGTVNLLNLFKWLVEKGWVKGTDLVAAIEFGVEIANGGGSPQTHRVNNYVLTAR